MQRYARLVAIAGCGAALVAGAVLWAVIANTPDGPTAEERQAQEDRLRRNQEDQQRRAVAELDLSGIEAGLTSALLIEECNRAIDEAVASVTDLETESMPAYDRLAAWPRDAADDGLLRQHLVDAASNRDSEPDRRLGALRLLQRLVFREFDADHLQRLRELSGDEDAELAREASRALAQSLAGAATARLLAKDFPAADALLSEAFTVRPEGSLSMYLQRSAFLRMQGRFAECETDCTQALALDSNNATALVNRAVSRYWQDNYHDALDDLSLLQTLDEPSARALSTMTAECQLGVGDHEAALESANKALASDPRDEIALAVQARVLTLQAKWADAADVFTKCIEIVESEVFYRQRARCYRELGQTELAEKDELRADSLRSPAEGGPP
jgi:tetratricopeptide (TPR) repeat protein